MNDDSLKNFLKENTSPVPEAPLGESLRIWRKIDERKSKKVWWLLAPVLATSVLAIYFVPSMQTAPHLSEEEIYLQKEWAAIQLEVDSEPDQELITIFEN